MYGDEDVFLGGTLGVIALATGSLILTLIIGLILNALRLRGR